MNSILGRPAVIAEKSLSRVKWTANSAGCPATSGGYSMKSSIQSVQWVKSSVGSSASGSAAPRLHALAAKTTARDIPMFITRFMGSPIHLQAMNWCSIESPTVTAQSRRPSRRHACNRRVEAIAVPVRTQHQTHKSETGFSGGSGRRSGERWWAASEPDRSWRAVSRLAHMCFEAIDQSKLRKNDRTGRDQNRLRRNLSRSAFVNRGREQRKVMIAM
jgi:hypothetical protein